MKLLKFNRIKTLAPKRGRFWCVCDRSLVSEYQKCSICGTRNGTRRFKK